MAAQVVPFYPSLQMSEEAEGAMLEETMAIQEDPAVEQVTSYCRSQVCQCVYVCKRVRVQNAQTKMIES